MKISELEYKLDPENICREPAEVRLGRRDLGRLFVVDRRSRVFHDSYMMEFPHWLSEGDVVVFNNSRRIPGIIYARLDNGAQVEIRFAQSLDPRSALARVYPAHFVEPGRVLTVDGGERMVIRAAAVPPYDLCELTSERPLSEVLQANGLCITSFFSGGFWKLENYTNVYASEEGNFESPMAGLHFTNDLLDLLTAKNIDIAFITLHPVGSWLPFLEEDVDDHKSQVEPFRISAEAADKVNRARAAGKRVVAIGTTVVRALEEATDEHGHVHPTEGNTGLFIKPGYKFRIVDGYFTNFHPARSSLMVLDAAFSSKELVLAAYEEAKKRKYLFHEFGDAVFYI